MICMILMNHHHNLYASKTNVIYYTYITEKIAKLSMITHQKGN